jgi:uncharacterized damage-inducible protein DinB
MKLSLLALLMLGFVMSPKAQYADSIKAQLLIEWNKAKAYTKEYLDAMPRDKYNFRPTDSMRTFSQQMLHLAQANAALASNGTGRKNLSIMQSRNFETGELAQSPDSVNYYVMLSYDYFIESIKGMDASKLDETIIKGRITDTRLGWLLKGYEHQTHHRGQTTVYFRLLGIKPPDERLFILH